MQTTVTAKPYQFITTSTNATHVLLNLCICTYGHSRLMQYYSEEHFKSDGRLEVPVPLLWGGRELKAILNDGILSSVWL